MGADKVSTLVFELFAAELGGIPLTDDLHLLETGIIDSLALTKLGAALETSYPGLRIPDSDLTPDNLGTVGLIRAYLASRLGRDQQ